MPSDFADVAADTAFYSRHFSREELERSLGTSAVRLNATGILVQRTARQTASQPVFHIESAKHRITRIATVPESVQLWDAVQIGPKMLLLMVGYTMLSLWILAQPIVEPTIK